MLSEVALELQKNEKRAASEAASVLIWLPRNYGQETRRKL